MLDGQKVDGHSAPDKRLWIDRERKRKRAASVCKFLGLADTGFESGGGGEANLHGPRICGDGDYLRQRFLLDCPRLLRLTSLSLSLARVISNQARIYEFMAKPRSPIVSPKIPITRRKSPSILSRPIYICARDFHLR